MFHSQCDYSTILGFLYSHVFIDDSIFGCRNLFFPFLVWQQALFIIVEVFMQLSGTFPLPTVSPRFFPDAPSLSPPVLPALKTETAGEALFSYKKIRHPSPYLYELECLNLINDYLTLIEITLVVFLYFPLGAAVILILYVPFLAFFLRVTTPFLLTLIYFFIPLGYLVTL